MYLKRILYAWCIIQFISLSYVSTEDNDQPPTQPPPPPPPPPPQEYVDEEADDEEVDTTPTDVHTFVAMIDVVFTDGARKTCTGTIIHDRVIVTAAHCFVIGQNAFLEPELSVSFVVIGTKKMFDAGYEQYLPIERVITHPNFKGWTADLALVYTFASMTSDKPGAIIPLAGERSSTPVDSNVTVLSWGRCFEEEEDVVGVTPILETVVVITSEIPEHKVAEDEQTRTTSVYKKGGTTEYDNEKPVRQGLANSFLSSEEFLRANVYSTKRKIRNYTKSSFDKREEFMYPYRVRYQIQESLGDQAAHINQYQPRGYQMRPTTDHKSRYLSIEKEERSPKEDRSDYKFHRQRSKTSRHWDQGGSDVYRRRRTEAGINRRETRKPALRPLRGASRRQGYGMYWNWRRYIAQEKNKLTVEMFGFVNVQACRKIVQRAMPALFHINNGNEILCYASDEHYITKEDSGAPALQRGQLAAVTVGGVETEGEHVAIGMKMSCFCNWIAQNLPNNAGERLKCCKNCCERHSASRPEERGSRKKSYKRSRQKKHNSRVVRLQSKTGHDYEEEDIESEMDSDKSTEN